MSISVNERAGEISVMRAIGVRRGTIVSQILLEGTALGVTGTVLGLGLGLLTARYLEGILSSFPGLPAGVRFFPFDAQDALQALGLLAACTAVAAVYPAWRAASLPIVESLRREAVA